MQTEVALYAKSIAFMAVDKLKKIISIFYVINY